MSTAPRPDRASGRILVDATELIHNPIRTGIQRVARALLEHWPDPEEIQLCRYSNAHGSLVTVPRTVLELLRETSAEAIALPPAELQAKIASHLGTPEPASASLPILVPELFFDLPRCAHHRWLLGHSPARSSFIAFDFIPWLHPEAIGVRESAHLMNYIQVLRAAKRVGFISAATRADFTNRITRRTGEAGPVFALGADGPKIPKQQWSPDRDTFLCVGSIDGRKNQDKVIAAFELLWARGIDAKLVLVGRVFENGHVQEVAAKVARLQATEPRFTHHADISDHELGALYTRARACIYASEIEGFGLPAVESLHCATPIIVHHALPSILDLPPAGQIRLETIDPEQIATAVMSLQSNKDAARLWKAAATLRTNGWREMAADVARWVHAPA